MEGMMKAYDGTRNETAGLNMPGAKSNQNDRGRSPKRGAKRNAIGSESLITDHVTHTTFGHENRDKSPSKRIYLYETK